MQAAPLCCGTAMYLQANGWRYRCRACDRRLNVRSAERPPPSKHGYAGYVAGCRCEACAAGKRAYTRRNRKERAACERAEAAAATRKKMLRADLIRELARRGRVYVPRSNAQNLEDAMRPVRYPGDAV